VKAGERVSIPDEGNGRNGIFFLSCHQPHIPPDSLV
jgi:hypothetical protein